VHSCILYGSQNTHCAFPYSALTNWFV